MESIPNSTSVDPIHIVQAASRLTGSGSSAPLKYNTCWPALLIGGYATSPRIGSRGDAKFAEIREKEKNCEAVTDLGVLVGRF